MVLRESCPDAWIGALRQLRVLGVRRQIRSPSALLSQGCVGTSLHWQGCRVLAAEGRRMLGAGRAATTHSRCWLVATEPKSFLSFCWVIPSQRRRLDLLCVAELSCGAAPEPQKMD